MGVEGEVPPPARRNFIQVKVVLYINIQFREMKHRITIQKVGNLMYKLFKNRIMEMNFLRCGRIIMHDV